MIKIIRALIGMKKHASKQGMICVSAQELQLIFLRTTQRLNPLMKNKRQVSRSNASILGLTCASDQLLGNTLITVSMEDADEARP